MRPASSGPVPAEPTVPDTCPRSLTKLTRDRVTTHNHAGVHRGGGGGTTCTPGRSRGRRADASRVRGRGQRLSGRAVGPGGTRVARPHARTACQHELASPRLRSVRQSRWTTVGGHRPRGHCRAAVGAAPPAAQPPGLDVAARTRTGPSSPNSSPPRQSSPAAPYSTAIPGCWMPGGETCAQHRARSQRCRPTVRPCGTPGSTATSAASWASTRQGSATAPPVTRTCTGPTSLPRI